MASVAKTSENSELLPARGHVWQHLRRCVAVTLIAGAALAMAVTPEAGAAVKQEHFASPDAAMQALVAAAKTGETKALLAVLGPEAKPIVDSGDSVADHNSRATFVHNYEAAHSIQQSDDKAVVEVGTDQWPFPIPLVKDSSGWRFDTAVGKEEIIDRRIGRNELATIQVCLAYVDAQREYYVRNPLGDPLYQYAQVMVSTAGKHDGLFWETTEDEAPSPFGPLVGRARGEGYTKAGRGGQPTPYHGYYYRILKAQGPDADGGAYDFVVRGKMLGGFALVAYPAEYRSSGVMTFMVNHGGVVFQKNLGPNSAVVARAMTAFNPDHTWTRIENAGQPQPTAAQPG